MLRNDASPVKDWVRFTAVKRYVQALGVETVLPARPVIPRDGQALNKKIFLHLIKNCVKM